MIFYEVIIYAHPFEKYMDYFKTAKLKSALLLSPTGDAHCLKNDAYNRRCEIL